ncbi:Protein wos2 [Thelohanellus kitauei]|uniref:Protein wos2 n=1 Tax=Thelohanellus kitauei TaxID=669202 RepID=A0A0C2IRG4_THEKT|nr:Protein wos2 [Thelohanellus kitauei]
MCVAAFRSKVPQILWHEDKEYVYVSYQVFNAKNVQVEMKDGFVDFKADGEDGSHYSVKVECFKEFDAEKSSHRVHGREVMVKLKKTQKESWSKLLKGGKASYVKPNWSHPVYDSDDEKAFGGNFDGMGMGDFDMDALNMGDEPDMEDEDDDMESEKDIEDSDDSAVHEKVDQAKVQQAS